MRVSASRVCADDVADVGVGVADDAREKHAGPTRTAVETGRRRRDRGPMTCFSDDRRDERDLDLSVVAHQARHGGRARGRLLPRNTGRTRRSSPRRTSRRSGTRARRRRCRSVRPTVRSSIARVVENRSRLRLDRADDDLIVGAAPADQARQEHEVAGPHDVGVRPRRLRSSPRDERPRGARRSARRSPRSRPARRRQIRARRSSAPAACRQRTRGRPRSSRRSPSDSEGRR